MGHLPENQGSLLCQIFELALIVRGHNNIN